MSRDDDHDLLTTPTPRVSLDEGNTVASQGGMAAPEEAYCSACGASFPPDANVCPHDGARLVKLKAQGDPMLGRVLDGRYEVRASLGEGGMGTVYRGLQLSVDREVAIKVIHPAFASERIAVKRFLREARLSSRLAQPSIVNVYDFGQTEDGVLYLVMELLRGRTLAAELDKGQALSVKRAAGIGLQLCDALESAHLQGIIHRDLKPGNIIILDDPPGRDLIKVLDFGLAKSLVSESSTRVTVSNALLGTPLYMAPEQITGVDADQRADLYALGCILFHVLSGRPPYMGGSVNVVLAAHMHEPIPALPAHVPVLLAETIQRLLAKAPDDRVQSASGVREVLQAVLAAPSIAGDPDDAVATVMLLKTPKLAPPISTEAPRAKQKRSWGAIGAVLAALVTIPIIILATGRDSDPSPANAPAPVVEPAKPAAVTPPLAPAAESTVKPEPPPAKQAERPQKAEKPKAEKPRATRSAEPVVSKPAEAPAVTKPVVSKPAEATPSKTPEPTGPSIDFYPSKKK